MNGQPMLPKWPNDRSSHKIFGGVSEDFLGGNGKAEGAKVLGAGIWPEAVPRRNEQQKKGWPTDLGRSTRYGPSYVSS
jgi:hypothetical protein